MIVIAPSAIYVPESLWNVGKLPPVIYPVGDRIVFDYLYEQYKETASEIRVTCFDGKEEVHKALESYGSQVKVMNLPRVTSLADSILCGLEGIGDDERICLNFADTFVLDDADDTPADCFFYSQDYYSDQWTYFETDENDKIMSIIDKPSIYSKNKIGKLFVGVFYFSDVPYFRFCLEHYQDVQLENVSTFYRALFLYMQKYAMCPVKTDQWFDVGHAENYYNTRLEVDTRSFNSIVIDKERGILKKSSTNTKKLIDEIKWYVKLPGELEYIRPRIFRYDVNEINPYVKMEYYAYHTIHELLLYGDLSYSAWRDVFERIRFVCKDMQQYRVTERMKIESSLYEMYLGKTKERLAQLGKIEEFSWLYASSFTVNGVTVPALSEIESTLMNEIEKHLLKREYFTIIHGDLCFSNILIDQNRAFIKVIDPRGAFGEYDIYGDPRYEMAKLFHSIEGGYDYLIKDRFTLSVNENTREIECRLKVEPEKIQGIWEVFRGSMSDLIGPEEKEIRLIEAALFFTMIPLHNESIKQQMAMLATGITLLNKVCDNRWK